MSPTNRVAITFLQDLPSESDAPAGQIFVRPKGADAQRRDMAAFVVMHGIEKLMQGSGPITTIVVPCHSTRPTLDDMLAATFVQRWMETQKFPPGAAAYARYAGLAREGLQPGDMPLESSMEGIFLALRTNAGDDLTNPATASRFLADWDRAVEVILQAADADKDPFVTNLFGESSQFARERAFLKKDQDVYREDVRRGKHWVVQLAGGPPQSAMLLLEQPRSLLWKYWSRRDSTAPVGGSYLLLVVNWGGGNWVISTDPVQRLGIRELAEKLQEAESRAAGPPAKDDPWFDGAPFYHTLVAAPRSGTKLSHSQVLSIIKKWARARSVMGVHRVQHAKAWIGGTALTILTAVVVQMITSNLNKNSAAHSTTTAPSASQPAQNGPP